jgi:hypothetical protein
MTNRIHAVFDTPEEATAVVTKLKREGGTGCALTLMSSEPLLIEGVDGHAERPSRIGLFAVAGGFLGAAAALLLTISTSRQVGLTTGGMPIVSPWAFGIIVFELGALGAIVFSLVRMIYEARLVRKLDREVYDESAVSEGKFVLVVDCPDEENHAVARNILGDRVEGI